MELERLVEQLIDDADTAHRQHLVTESYAEHVALGEFYAGVRSGMDSFVEAAIGVGQPVPELDEVSTLDSIEASYLELLDERDDTCAGNTTLEAIYDNVLAVYAAVLYKRKRLK
jgi:hypothetical protein